MSHPVNVALDAERRVANWRPLVQWILAIPHLVIANALSSLGQAVAVVSWFVILFTGRLPAGLAEVQCLVMRYSLRSYAYAIWLHEEFPPFEFTSSGPDPGGHPVRLDITPQLDGRNRATVFFRLVTAIPILIVAAFWFVVAFFVVVVSWFAVLFTGRYPDGLRDFVVRVLQLGNRLNAYVMLLVDDYPPFGLESAPTS